MWHDTWEVGPNTDRSRSRRVEECASTRVRATVCADLKDADETVQGLGRRDLEKPSTPTAVRPRSWLRRARGMSCDFVSEFSCRVSNADNLDEDVMIEDVAASPPPLCTAGTVRVCWKPAAGLYHVDSPLRARCERRESRDAPNHVEPVVDNPPRSPEGCERPKLEASNEWLVDDSECKWGSD